MRLALLSLPLLAALAVCCSCSGPSDSGSDTTDIKNDWNLVPNPEKVDFALPGWLVVDGNPLQVGTPIGWVIHALGQPESTRDMGAAGLVLLYPKWSLEVLVALPTDTWGMPADDPNGRAGRVPADDPNEGAGQNPADDPNEGAGQNPADDPNGARAQEPYPPVEQVVAFHLLPGFAGKGPDGLGLGVDEAALTKALGSPLPDPFGQGLWFPDSGLFAQVSQGKITMITLSGSSE
ncbi:MAG: hypothetical protein FJ109_20560 [Deltaproteobacteria bacterium]|nr:hypothetical protein [Deltaproteobacteria bacterium]